MLLPLAQWTMIHHQVHIASHVGAVFKVFQTPSCNVCCTPACLDLGLLEGLLKVLLPARCNSHQAVSGVSALEGGEMPGSIDSPRRHAPKTIDCMHA